MNDQKLIEKVNTTMSKLCYQQGYASVVDVLMECGILERKRYLEWRSGKVDYLERVCTVNLSKLNLVLNQMNKYAQLHSLKSSYCFYKKYGKGKKVQLRFTKSNSSTMEKRYATHYVDLERTEELKKINSND